VLHCREGLSVASKVRRIASVAGESREPDALAACGINSSSARGLVCAEDKHLLRWLAFQTLCDNLISTGQLDGFGTSLLKHNC
jgi:hypothetical protein